MAEDQKPDIRHEVRVVCPTHGFKPTPGCCHPDRNRPEDEVIELPEIELEEDDPLGGLV